MEWVQILIDYEPDYLALYADKLFCRIEGHRILADGYVETWDNPNDVQGIIHSTFFVNYNHTKFFFNLHQMWWFHLGHLSNPKIRVQLMSTQFCLWVVCPIWA